MATTATVEPGFLPAQMLRQAGLLIAIAASVAIGGYTALNLMKPDLTVLTGDLAPRDLTALAGDLEGAGIKHSVDYARGVILVDAARKEEALRFVADKDLTGGFERDPFLDDDAPMTETFLRERERMKRSQELRLARTIADLAYVKNARVHLATPKPSPFLRSNQEARASVMVEMYQGRRLSEEQIGGIAQIVVNAVANLTPDNVTIVDHLGYPLNAPDSGELAQATRRLDYKRHIEDEKVRKITELLAPYVGFDGVQAKVDAEIDFTEIEQAIDYHDPDRGAVISVEERTVERSAGGDGGVPGALSNAPPGTAQAPEETEAAADGENGGEPAAPAKELAEREVRRNQVPATREIKHVRPAPGRIERLTVSVVVRKDLLGVEAPGEAQTDEAPDPAAGQAAGQAAIEAELDRIRRLIIGAVGINEARGDTLTVEAVAFRAPESIEPLPAAPIWQQPWVMSLARQLGGALFALVILVLFVRPAIRSLSKPVAARAVESDEAAGALAAPEGAAGAGSVPQLPGSTQGQNAINQAMLADGGLTSDMEQVKALVGEDPKLATQVVRKWIEEE